jgi:hypothetical protein
MFIPIVCDTFFARVRPVSSRANPSCMNMTRKPVSSVHAIFVAVCKSPNCRVRSETCLVRSTGSAISEFSSVWALLAYGRDRPGDRTVCEVRRPLLSGSCGQTKIAMGACCAPWRMGRSGGRLLDGQSGPDVCAEDALPRVPIEASDERVLAFRPEDCARKRDGHRGEARYSSGRKFPFELVSQSPGGETQGHLANARRGGPNESLSKFRSNRDVSDVNALAAALVGRRRHP